MRFLEELFSVAGKTALVTGGSAGIGLMIARTLVRAGAEVMVASRKPDACEAVATQLNAEGPGRAHALPADISCPEGVAALAAAVRSRTDRLHILVNNAGRSWGAAFEDYPWDAWDRVLSLNVTGLFCLTRDLVPLLRAAASPEDPARIINLGSAMGTQPIGDKAWAYSVSKAGVHHMTRILARDLAGQAITVNAIAPGPFRSRMTAFATEDSDSARTIAAKVPAGRLGCERDLAGAVLYLAGPAGAYTTGAILPLDGGISVDGGSELFSDIR